MKELKKNSIIKQWPHYQKILTSQKYSQWKESDIVEKRSFLYHLILAISILYVLINLIMKIIQQSHISHIIQFVLYVILEIGLIFFYIIFKKIQIYFFVQYCLTSVYILITTKNEEDSKICMILYLIVLNCHSSLFAKILLYLYFIAIIAIQYEYEIFEILVIAIIAILHNIQLESHFITNYIKQLKLLSILEQMPNAVCVIDQSNTITFSNQLFDKLAQTLQIVDDSAQLMHHNNSKEILQMEFIRNLNLEEVKNDGFQISDFIPQLNDEGITDDQYKIINIDFKRQPSQNTIQNISFMSPNSAGTKKKKSYDIFSDINTNDYLLNCLRKSYITTINLQLQISHQPKSFILSAKTKRRKKSSNTMNVNNKQSSSKNICQISRFQDLQNSLYCENLKLSPNHTDTLNHNLVEQSYPHIQNIFINDGQASYTNHKVRLLVNIIQINDVLNNDQEYSIYCINELSPLLLQYTVKKLEQAKKNIMRSLSHELRTSLNAVNGYIAQAYERIDNIQQVDRNLNLSLKYINLMQLKLQDFFDYRDILEDQFVLKEEKFDLRNIIFQCADLVRDQCLNKKLNLQLELPDDSIIVFGDQQRLQQVLINLLTNGIKFTEQGGITIKVIVDNKLDSLPGLEDDEDLKNHQLVQIRIIDSGQGMKDDLKGILNKKFLSVDDDAKISKDSVGIGLGLSVCQAIIRAMGPQRMNSLFLESILGVGSQFYFYLNYESIIKQTQEFIDYPEQENKEITIVKTSPTKRSVLRKMDTQPNAGCFCNKLLIVDDEQFNLDILSQIIKGFNNNKNQYQIVTATNGIQALDLIKKQYFEECNCLGFKAILMDINMPQMNGWDCAKYIRLFENEKQIQKKTPIIAITGFGAQKDQEKCLKNGFDSVIIKPADKQKIQKIFKDYNI